MDLYGYLTDSDNVELFCYWSRFAKALDAWNAESEIHSLSHWKRVMILGLMLCESSPEYAEYTEWLCMAAAFHDTRRRHDGSEPGHGARAADYYEQYCQSDPEIEYVPDVAFAMRWHDMPDDDGAAALDDFEGDHDTAWTFFQLFKDADALDRVRLGDLDERYLRLPQSPALVDKAHRLFEELA